MTAIDSALRQDQHQNKSPLHSLTSGVAVNHPGARVGQLLCGRYRLEHLLGKGAMGEVYRATDTERQEPCAVKLVLPDASLTLQALRRLVQEAKVISRLYHPNIVEVREFQQDSDGTYLLVMELLQGVDLQTVLDEPGRGHAVPRTHAHGVAVAFGIEPLGGPFSAVCFHGAGIRLPR